MTSLGKWSPWRDRSWLRVAAAVLLLVAAIVWATVRGLDSCALSPAGIGYDLDQPPVVLALVGMWIFYRSRCT
ncbi:MAG: hypothetical protein JST59_27180 [Actinobacteria bacterium]|nr:hypothetical protein [Actinomycetota bacterium]